MIISTVNFVNNYKFSDFILDKISEEQNVRDEEIKKVTKRHSFCVATSSTDVEFEGRKRSSLRGRYSGEYSKTQKQKDADSRPIITIATTDGFRLTADTTSLHVALKKSTRLSGNNVFRQMDFGPDPEGQGRLNVFQLHSNPSYFLATTNLRHLELQSYCDDTLDPECPDERFFRSFHSQYGVELLQPHAHKGFYIHHIDDFINLRKFELNFRPPEEFFLNFEILTMQEIRRLETTSVVPKNTSSGILPTASHSDSTAGATGVTHTHSGSNSLTRTVVPDISKSSLKRKDSKKKNKTNETPFTPKSGMLSCFGLSGFKKKKNKNKH